MNTGEERILAEILPLVSVCICTYKRNELLFALLNSLAEQNHSDFSFEIIVVDNDKNASAKSAVSEFLSLNSTLIVRYAIEPQQGISFARNRTVAMAEGEYLAFIDDDEIASSNWLFDLLTCLSATNADAAFGPVLPIFPLGSEDWVIKSGLFERPRPPHCSSVKSGGTRTSNAIVKARWCKERTPHCFKESLAWSGGEDHDFFKWMESNGANLVWSDTATVSEIVPLERQRIGFILERRFRASVTYWRGVNATRPMQLAVRDAAIGLVGGAVCLIGGGLLLPIGLARAIRYWCKAMNGFGRVVALTDIRLVGYGGAK